ncbi:MAG: heme exporter protein CcmB [Gammaproteobacteria bacterium]
MSLTKAFMRLLRRDLLLVMRHRSQAANPILFFVIVASLFPLATGPEQSLLQKMAPGIVWVAALLATMLSLDAIFRSDFEDGSLEQLMLSPHPASVLVLAKVIAHWSVTGLPLLIAAPFMAFLYGLPTDASWTLLLSLLIGTPVLSLVGSVGVALTVALRHGGVILSLLVLPLYVPVLIFGSGAVQLTLEGISPAANLYMLSAILALALVLTPWPAAAALRLSLS